MGEQRNRGNMDFAPRASTVSTADVSAVDVGVLCIPITSYACGVKRPPRSTLWVLSYRYAHPPEHDKTVFVLCCYCFRLIPYGFAPLQPRHSPRNECGSRATVRLGARAAAQADRRFGPPPCRRSVRPASRPRRGRQRRAGLVRAHGGALRETDGLAAIDSRPVVFGPLRCTTAAPERAHEPSVYDLAPRICVERPAAADGAPHTAGAICATN